MPTKSGHGRHSRQSRADPTKNHKRAGSRAHHGPFCGAHPVASRPHRPYRRLSPGALLRWPQITLWLVPCLIPKPHQYHTPVWEQDSGPRLTSRSRHPDTDYSSAAASGTVGLLCSKPATQPMPTKAIAIATPKISRRKPLSCVADVVFSACTRSIKWVSSS